MKIIENQCHKSLKEWQFADVCGLCRWIHLSHSGRDILFSLRVQHQTICSYLFYITTAPSHIIPLYLTNSYHISPIVIIILYSSVLCSFIVIPNRSVSFYGPHWPSIKWKKYENMNTCKTMGKLGKIMKNSLDKTCKHDQNWSNMKDYERKSAKCPHVSPHCTNMGQIWPSTPIYIQLPSIYIYILYKMENDWEIPVNWDLIPSKNIHNHPYIFSII